MGKVERRNGGLPYYSRVEIPRLGAWKWSPSVFRALRINSIRPTRRNMQRMEITRCATNRAMWNIPAPRRKSGLNPKSVGNGFCGYHAKSDVYGGDWAYI